MAKIRLDEDAKKHLLNRIWQDYEFAKKERDQHIAGWADSRDQYESKWVELRKIEDDEELDQLFYVPMTGTQIDRLWCTLMRHFFPQAGPAKLGKVSASKATDPDAAEKLDQCLHAKFDIELDPTLQYADAFKACLIEQCGVLKGWWEMSPTRRNGRPPKINRAGFAFVPNESAGWDPYALSLNDIRFFFHEVWMTEDELWERQKKNKFQGVEKVVNPGKDEAQEDEWRKNIGGAGNKARYLYKILEFWGPQQLVGQIALDEMHRQGKHEPSADIVAWAYSNKVLLGVEKNRYAAMHDNPTPYEKLPFWIVLASHKVASTYGYSKAEMLKDMQREVNMLHNNRQLAVQMEMSAKLFYDSSRLQDLNALYAARYGGAVPVNGPPNDAVKWFVPQTSTGNMVTEKAMMDRAIMDRTGVTNIHFGGHEPGVETATGMTLITAEGNVTQDTMLAFVAVTGVLPVLRFFAECCKEYLTGQEVWDIVGGEQEPVKQVMDNGLKGIITHDYKIEVEAGVSATAKAIQLRNIQSALSALAQMTNADPELIRAAMMALFPSLMRLLGQPEAAALFDKQPQGEAAAAPAGRQVGRMPNLENELAMAAQGRSPMPEEQPRMPVLAGRGR